MSSLEERFQLEGKVAVMIGGSGHLGSALVKAMVAAGMKVAVLDRRGPAGRRSSLNPLFLKCDATSKSALLRCRRAILKRFGRIDGLLNGAGANAPTPFLKIAEREFRRIVEVNLLGTLLACQVFGETMVRRKTGSIINFSSVSAEHPLSKAFVYSASKAGVSNLTKNLAREWAPDRVRVNALRPGFFPTAWSMKHFIDPQRKAAILKHTPMGRFGQPGDLVGAVLWLLSDASQFVTGAIIAVDGGFTAMTI